MKSIIQRSKECIVCGTTQNLHLHHIFFGVANRKISDRNGFTCYLCGYHHNLSNQGVHSNRELDLMLKRLCQEKYESMGYSREDFIRLIGKSYILD